MSEDHRPGRVRAVADVGFHAGELAVQQRAGTREEAARLSPMLDPAELRGGIVAFLADRTFAVITARDADGRLWSSPLTGPAGFLEAVTPTTLAIHARLPDGDPLRGLPAGQQAGLVVVEFATRRRVRVNGTLSAVGARHPRDRGRAGLRELPAVHSPARPRPGRSRPGRPGRRQAGHGPLPGRYRADPRGGHVLPRHHEPGTRLRHLAPGRRAGIRPGRRQPALVAGLPGQQPLQLVRQPGRRSRGGTALLRLRHRPNPPAVRHGRGRLGRGGPAGRRRADRPARRLHRAAAGGGPPAPVAAARGQPLPPQSRPHRLTGSQPAARPGAGRAVCWQRDWSKRGRPLPGSGSRGVAQPARQHPHVADR